ncbi:MAG TPA: signal peptidase I [Bacteroidales bacterium]|nr:signal peptidase I [Bacteroidales bacterium]
MSIHRKHIDELRNISVSLLSEGKTIRIKAHGYSMYPTIKPGMVIMIEPIRLKGLPQKGEIVAINKDKGIVVHRIVEIIDEGGKKKYIARGDSNPFPDAPVTIDMIPGRVTGLEGFARLPAEFSKKPNYFLNRLRVIMIHIAGRFKNLKNKIIN